MALCRALLGRMVGSAAAWCSSVWSRSSQGRDRSSLAVAEVAGYLGNTPAVARASYIYPRVIKLYEADITIAPALRDLGRNSKFGDLATRGAAERAVVRMLTSHG